MTINIGFDTSRDKVLLKAGGKRKKRKKKKKRHAVRPMDKGAPQHRRVRKAKKTTRQTANKRAV